MIWFSTTLCRDKYATTVNPVSCYPAESQRLHCYPMSDSTSEKKVGGGYGNDYGNIRAPINVDNLNVYLAKNTPSIKTPVGVKQFKVCVQSWNGGGL